MERSCARDSIEVLASRHVCPYTLNVGAEVIMSSQRNEYSNASEFVGKLRAECERVPVHVYTRLSMMTDETARDVWKNKGSGHDAAPQYVLSSAGDLSLTLSLQATGRHYFTWRREPGQ